MAAVGMALFATPAHADTLPKDYLGTWCFDVNIKGMSVYSRSGCDGPIIMKIDRNGYTWNDDDQPEIKCKFVSVKPVREKFIRTVARCTSKGEKGTFIETQELLYQNSESNTLHLWYIE